MVTPYANMAGPAVGVNARPMGLRKLAEGTYFNLNSLALSD